MHYAYLLVAILSEVVATTALKSAAGFTRLGPSLIVAVGYGSAFYFLSLCLDKIPVGVAYSIWAGLGIVLIAGLSAAIYKQIPDTAAILGMALIVAGIVVLNLFSDAQVH